MRTALCGVTCWFFYVFFFNDTATTEIYTLSLHDALPISLRLRQRARCLRLSAGLLRASARFVLRGDARAGQPTQRKDDASVRSHKKAGGPYHACHAAASKAACNQRTQNERRREAPARACQNEAR